MAEYLANLIKDLPYVVKEALLKNGHIETLLFPDKNFTREIYEALSLLGSS